MLHGVARTGESEGRRTKERTLVIARRIGEEMREADGVLTEAGWSRRPGELQDRRHEVRHLDETLALRAWRDPGPGREEGEVNAALVQRSLDPSRVEGGTHAGVRRAVVGENEQVGVRKTHAIENATEERVDGLDHLPVLVETRCPWRRVRMELCGWRVVRRMCQEQAVVDEVRALQPIDRSLRRARERGREVA